MWKSRLFEKQETDVWFYDVYLFSGLYSCSLYCETFPAPPNWHLDHWGSVIKKVQSLKNKQHNKRSSVYDLRAGINRECSFYLSLTVLWKSSHLSKINQETNHNNNNNNNNKNNHKIGDSKTSKLIYLSMFIVLTQEKRNEIREKFICQLQCLPLDLVYVCLFTTGS